MTNRLIAYYRPFPWRRIGAARTGRTSVEKTIRAYCGAHHVAVQTFLVETDSVIRRSLEDRVVGKKLMQKLREGEAGGIVACRPEHIFSSAADATTTLERWMDTGVDFLCIDFNDGEPLDLCPETATLEGRFVIRGLSELQRRIDAERSHQRVVNRQGSGTWQGRVPFGFRTIHGVLVEDADRIERILRMKTAHRRGASYRQIARANGISIATAHRLIKTDLRKLRRIGTEADSVQTAPPEAERSSRRAS